MTTESQMTQHALLIIDRVRRRRKVVADTLKAGRRYIGRDDVKTLQSRLRDYYGWELIRPTRSAFLQEANRLRKFASSEMPGAPGCNGGYVGFDGYSYCGLADAHEAERDGALAEAKVWEHAATHLLP